MASEPWRNAKELYYAARERSSNERSEFLAEACGGDPELRCEVESLLANDVSDDARLDLPVWTDAKSTVTLSGAAGVPVAVRIPGHIGDYRILRLIGEGGMGSVYEAEQQHPRRIVALKVIKPGSMSAERLRRFELESQALGRLQHPGIAQIFEAGTADTGFGPQPYFAMEFIHGETLRDYVQTHPVNTRQRLELMAKVADAVHHAHQRGLIHRDLKPGNILVNETGQPKVLDFGVARVTDSDAQATRQTDLGELVGTLAYMSPEQVLADPLELDTRSDVYALGVILYELLAGRLPYTISKKLHEAVQAIREEDPARLSSISRAYRGDIETIVAKALEKDKGRRYGSAAALATDLRRYLHHEPIAARPASTAYQLRKFARRNKALVTGVAAVFAVLAAGVVVSTREAIRANQEAQRANREAAHATDEAKRANQEAATAKAINDFLQNDLLSQASAYAQSRDKSAPDPDLKVRTALDRAAARISGKFQGQPAVEASIRYTIANTYQELGLAAQAEKQLRQTVDLRRRTLGEEHADTLRSMSGLATALTEEGKFAQADALFTKVLAIQRRRLGDANEDTLATMNDLANTKNVQGKFAEAEALYQSALEGRTTLLGQNHPNTLRTMFEFAEVYVNEGKYAQGTGLLSKTLELDRRVRGDNDPNTLQTMAGLGYSLNLEGKPREAEPLLVKAFSLQRVVLGEKHQSTTQTMQWLAELYQSQGKFGLAEELLVRALEIQRQVIGEEHRDTVTTMRKLAALYQAQGKNAEAERILTKALETSRRRWGADHPDTLSIMDALGTVYTNENQFLRAEPLFSEVLRIRRRVLGNDHASTSRSVAQLGALYAIEGNNARAEPYVIESLGIQRRVLGRAHPSTLTSQSTLGVLYRNEGKYAQAEPILAEVLEIRRRVLGEENPDTVQSRYSLAVLYQRQAKFPEAEPLFLQAATEQERILGPKHPDTLRTVNAIVQLYHDWGKPEQEADWRKKSPADNAARTKP